LALGAMLLSGINVSAEPWANYQFGIPHTNDTFLFGDFTANANKQITAPDLAKYVVTLKLPNFTDTNNFVGINNPNPTHTLDTGTNSFLNSDGSAGFLGNGIQMGFDGGGQPLLLVGSPNGGTVASILFYDYSGVNQGSISGGGDAFLSSVILPFGQSIAAQYNSITKAINSIVLDDGGGNLNLLAANSANLFAYGWVNIGGNVCNTVNINASTRSQLAIGFGANSLGNGHTVDVNGDLFATQFLDGSGAVPQASSILTNVTVNTYGPISAGVVQNANGAAIYITNSYVPPVILVKYGVFNTLANSNILLITTNGNDATAIRGNTNFPFLTITNAIAKCSNNDVIYIMAGNYSMPNNTNGVIIPSGVSILGDTNGVVNIAMPIPSAHFAAGFVLTNSGITLANFNLYCTNTISGYDTYPIYSGTLPIVNGAMAFNNINVTNIFFYNINVSGYSDALFIKNYGTIQGQALKSTFSSLYDDANLQSGSLNSFFSFEDCKFIVNPVSPYLGYAPSRGIALNGFNVLTKNCQFIILNGKKTSPDPAYNVAFSVEADAAPYPATVTALNNTYYLSSPYVASYVYQVYVNYLGGYNTAVNVFNTDFSANINQINTNHATVNWWQPPSTESVSIQTNSTGPHGYILNFFGGQYTGHSTY